jgi:hypothetical protein
MKTLWQRWLFGLHFALLAEEQRNPSTSDLFVAERQKQSAPRMSAYGRAGRLTGIFLVIIIHRPVQQAHQIIFVIFLLVLVLSGSETTG